MVSQVGNLEAGNAPTNNGLRQVMLEPTSLRLTVGNEGPECWICLDLADLQGCFWSV